MPTAVAVTPTGVVAAPALTVTDWSLKGSATGPLGPVSVKLIVPPGR